MVLLLLLLLLLSHFAVAREDFAVKDANQRTTWLRSAFILILAVLYVMVPDEERTSGLHVM